MRAVCCSRTEKLESALAAEDVLSRREVALEEAVIQSVAAEALDEERYRLGLTDIITVLSSQRTAATSESQLLTIRRARLDNRRGPSCGPGRRVRSIRCAVGIRIDGGRSSKRGLRMKLLLRILLPLLVLGGAGYGTFVMMQNRPPPPTRVAEPVMPLVETIDVSFENVLLSVRRRGNRLHRCARPSWSRRLPGESSRYPHPWSWAASSRKATSCFA